MNLDHPFMSVIVATYNASAYIDRTLESIREQLLHGHEVEVVVVDGASTDDTVQRVKNSGLPVVLRSEPDKGIYDAMNIGVEMASGRWVQFLNAGDAFHDRESLAEVLHLVENASDEVQWAIAGAQNMQGGGGPPRTIRNLPFHRRQHLFGLQPHCHQACWFSRTSFRMLGGHRLDMGIVADYDLIARFAVMSAPAEVSTVVIDYLGGGVSEVPAAETAKRLHEARVRRFALGTVSALADRLFSIVLGVVNGQRVAVGALRQVVRHRAS